jgi:hopanoid C-2 methylase
MNAYAPERLFARFRYQVDATYANRLRLPAKGKLTKVNLKRGAVLAWNIVWRIGIVSDYRAAFWKAAWHALRRGQIEAIFGMGFVAWHLIQFTQEALGGRQSASFYAAKQSSTEA